jgi:cytochrome b6-f complex iron-sulfur subunit
VSKPYSGRRRSFLHYLLLFMASAVAMVLTWGAARFVLFRTARKRTREVSAEIVDKLQPNVPVHVPEAGAWLLKPTAGDDLVALDDRCSHLGCRTKWNSQKQLFECPCHGSEFHMDGRVAHGPATRPLSRLAVSKEANHKIRLLERPPGKTGS